MQSTPSTCAQNVQTGPAAHAQDQKTSNSGIGSEGRKTTTKKRIVVNQEEIAADGPIKERVQWTAELHEHFLQACEKLGGAHRAKPSEILATMRVPGLSLNHVKSHLQKYRLTIGIRNVDKAQQFGLGIGQMPSQYDTLDGALTDLLAQRPLNMPIDHLHKRARLGFGEKEHHISSRFCQLDHAGSGLSRDQISNLFGNERGWQAADFNDESIRQPVIGALGENTSPYISSFDQRLLQASGRLSGQQQQQVEGVYRPQEGSWAQPLETKETNESLATQQCNLQADADAQQRSFQAAYSDRQGSDRMNAIEQALGIAGSDGAFSKSSTQHQVLQGIAGLAEIIVRQQAAAALTVRSDLQRMLQLYTQVEKQLLESLNAYKRVGQALQSSTMASLLALAAASEQHMPAVPSTFAGLIGKEQFSGSTQHEDLVGVPSSCAEEQETFHDNIQQEQRQQGQQTTPAAGGSLLSGQLGVAVELLSKAVLTLPEPGDVQPIARLLQQLFPFDNGSLGKPMYLAEQTAGSEEEMHDVQHAAELQRMLDLLIAGRSAPCTDIKAAPKKYSD